MKNYTGIELENWSEIQQETFDRLWVLHNELMQLDLDSEEADKLRDEMGPMWDSLHYEHQIEFKKRLHSVMDNTALS